MAMMFADLVDLVDLTGQLREFGINLNSDADPGEINQATEEWLLSATTEQVKALLESLEAFQQASQGLILPAAKDVLDTLLDELRSR
ncbi:MAG: hypothetical protein HWE12_01095 [Oceanospirillaceae bacterium]|nr:hypothetical protein [Oceanospirillaceae bacterium]